MSIIKKFLSRKFILTVLSSAFSIVFALSGALGETGTVFSVIAAFFAPVIYVVTEGRIDAKALSMISESVDKVSEIIENKDGCRGKEGDEEGS